MTLWVSTVWTLLGLRRPAGPATEHPSLPCGQLCGSPVHNCPSTGENPPSARHRVVDAGRPSPVARRCPPPVSTRHTQGERGTDLRRWWLSTGSTAPMTTTRFLYRRFRPTYLGISGHPPGGRRDHRPEPACHHAAQGWRGPAVRLVSAPHLCAGRDACRARPAPVPGLSWRLVKTRDVVLMWSKGGFR